ncbi:MAG: hypothetical protein Q9205_003163 [Flavoplaca limonia]
MSDRIDFILINGSIECHPAVGVAEQYDGPYYRFLDNERPICEGACTLGRSMSRTAVSPEDFVGEWLRRGITMTPAADACDLLEQQIEQHPDGPFNGVLGFSEGCSVAASLMLRRAPQGKLPLFKFAIYFCAISAFRLDTPGAILADQCSDRINVSTLHVVGARDPALLSSFTLYNLCHEDLAALYDHGKGHTIPWGPVTEHITSGVRECLRRAQHGP